MTISFKDDNYMILYAFEKVISFARKDQVIFVAQTVWRLASISKLQRGLIDPIANLANQSAIIVRGVSTTPQDTQEELPYNTSSIHTHPDRVRQLEDSVDQTSAKERRADKVLDSAELFLKHSTREWEKYIRDPLH